MVLRRWPWRWLRMQLLPLMPPLLPPLPRSRPDAAATPTLEVSIPDGYKYDGVNPVLVTTEGGTVPCEGAGYTKEWRAQHGTVALYIAPANYAPSGYEIPTEDAALRGGSGLHHYR